MVAEGLSVPVRVVVVDAGRVEALEEQLARLTAQLAHIRRERDAAVSRVTVLETRLSKADRERGRLVEQNRTYRAQLRQAQSRFW